MTERALQMKKTSSDVLFTWLKPEYGHEWTQKGRWRGARYLVPVLGARRKVTEYVPHPGLFRTFAGLNIAKDEVREREISVFAKAYGDLIARPQDDHERLTTEREMVRTHATMGAWCRTIQHMRRAVELWDRINSPERHEDLKQLFTRQRGAILYRQTHHPLEINPDGKTRPAQPEGQEGRATTTCPAIVVGKDAAKDPASDVIPLARKALQYEIQRAFTDTETPSHTTSCIVTPELRLVLRPVNLLAYMWLSFARVVSGEIEERPCEMFETCGEYIYVGRGLGLKRDDAAVCGATCRKWKERHKAEKCA